MFLGACAANPPHIPSPRMNSRDGKADRLRELVTEEDAAVAITLAEIERLRRTVARHFYAAERARMLYTEHVNAGVVRTIDAQGLPPQAGTPWAPFSRASQRWG